MNSKESINPCVFCNIPIAGSRTKEHIMPVWLLKYLGIRKDKISPTHFNLDNGTKAITTRNHSLNSLVAPVCAKCNNYFLSHIEVSAKQIIIDLMECNNTIVDLNVDERFNLARWAFKTALTLNLGSNFIKNIPIEHYHYLYDNCTSLPDNVCVVAQQHHFNRPFYWVQGSNWIVHNVKGGEVGEDIHNSYKIGFQFKHLLLLVAFKSIPDYKFVIERGIHVPLYPVKGPIGHCENHDFTWDDSIKALMGFYMGLRLAESI